MSEYWTCMIHLGPGNLQHSLDLIVDGIVEIAKGKKFRGLGP